ncbi:MAG TPA: mannose-6-phosphate isomerase, class I, partial [Desulfosalsimonadaceae bacterium]|nr:mannose-6-phosphate isomerase, class I [Desulfosalsimonadaceae bacterium]
MENKPLWLQNEIQDYAWGSYTFIQSLLGETRNDTPWAELWMGAHPKAPSRVLTSGGWQRLDELIATCPEKILGPATARRYNNCLPYLFKVLAAQQPLSLQAHPDEEQARNGCAREDHEGIPLDAPHRNYKDDRRKPECLCALTPFHALKGFRPISEMTELFSEVCPKSLADAMEFLRQSPHANGLKRFFEALMTLPENKLQEVLEETTANAMARQEEREEFRWIKALSEMYPEDAGILSPILLNLICLQPGEALFLNSGEMHAYLEGCGIEIMANSDNVLRGGLTAKHVDVAELMRALDFTPRKSEILTPQAGAACESVYPTPVAEF